MTFAKYPQGGGSGVPVLTANRAVASDGSGALVASSVTDTELGYLSGATSNIQTQISALSGGGFTTDSSTSIANIADSLVILDAGATVTVSGTITNSIVICTTGTNLTCLGNISDSTIRTIGTLNVRGNDYRRNIFITGTFQTQPASGVTFRENMMQIGAFQMLSGTQHDFYECRMGVESFLKTGSSSQDLRLADGCEFFCENITVNCVGFDFIIFGEARVYSRLLSFGSGTIQVNGFGKLELGMLDHNGTGTLSTGITESGSNLAVSDIQVYKRAASCGNVTFSRARFGEIVLASNETIEAGGTSSNINIRNFATIGRITNSGTTTLAGVTTATMPTQSRNVVIDDQYYTWIESNGTSSAYDKTT